MAIKPKITFRWTSNAQQPKAAAVKVETDKLTEGIARMVLRDVAISASEKSYQDARRSLERSIVKEIRNELNRMAKAIGRQITKPDKYTGPHGTLSITSQDFDRGHKELNDSPNNAKESLAGSNTLSDTARATWGNRAQTFQMASSRIKWAPRDPKYLRKKKNKGWWNKTGELKRYLSSSVKGDWYERAFGPIKVTFTRNRKAVKAGIDRSSGSWDTHRVTVGSSRGALSHTVNVGRINVVALGRITPDMLPALATGNPEGTGPGKGAGVAQLLQNRYGRNRQVLKLMGRSTTYTGKWKDVRINAKDDPDQERAKLRKQLWGKTYRMEKRRLTQPSLHRLAIDPFVSFYLTRAIPNAVWRRIERTARPTMGQTIQNVRSSGY